MIASSYHICQFRPKRTYLVTITFALVSYVVILKIKITINHIFLLYGFFRYTTFGRIQPIFKQFLSLLVGSQYFLIVFLMRTIKVDKLFFLLVFALPEPFSELFEFIFPAKRVTIGVWVSRTVFDHIIDSMNDFLNYVCSTIWVVTAWIIAFLRQSFY